MKLSVILPSIRIDRIDGLYQSFEKSYSGDWEIIVVSPYPLTDFYKSKSNVKYVQDWGSPIRCQQLGLLQCEGEFITRAVDDSLYVPGAMDEAIEKMDEYIKTVVMLKYTETNASVDTKHPAFQNMRLPKFYTLEYHNQTLKPYVPAHYLLLNFGIVHYDFIISIGGWDCQFETQALGELDLAIRFQMDGAKFVMTDDIILKCDWMPGTEGDHAPMHYGFDADNEKYSKIYCDPSCEDRVIIDINNWKQSPEKWERRFGK